MALSSDGVPSVSLAPSAAALSSAPIAPTPSERTSISHVTKLRFLVCCLLLFSFYVLFSYQFYVLDRTTITSTMVSDARSAHPPYITPLKQNTPPAMQHQQQHPQQPRPQIKPQTKDLGAKNSKGQSAKHIDDLNNENMKTKDPKPKDSKPKDSKPKDSKPKDPKPKDSKPKDPKPKDPKPKDPKPKDPKPKDPKPKDPKPTDMKLKIPNPLETQKLSTKKQVRKQNPNALKMQTPQIKVQQNQQQHQNQQQQQQQLQQEKSVNNKHKQMQTRNTTQTKSYYDSRAVEIDELLRNGSLPMSQKLNMRPRRVNEDRPRTLEFQVCGGLTNQRIAIITAAALARWTNRILILPHLQEDFIQESPWVPFSSFYDEEHFIRTVTDMEQMRYQKEVDEHMHAIRAYNEEMSKFLERNKNAISKGEFNEKNDTSMPKKPESPIPPLMILNKLPKASTSIVPFRIKIFRRMFSVQKAQAFFATLEKFPRLITNCGFFSMDLLESMEIARFIWKVDSALKFSRRIENDVAVIASKIDLSKTAFLHVRIEQDWIDHCQKWIGDNCYSSPQEILEFLRRKNIQNDTTLYIAGITIDHDELAPIKAAYKTTSKEMLIPDQLGKYKGSRDLLAAVDYSVSKKTQIFIGNSVSTFSALILTERFDQDLPQLHYNEGIIPLEGFLPSIKRLEFKLHGQFTWIFSLNPEDVVSVKMAMVAVLSARAKTTLKMICLMATDNKEVTAWFEKQNVQVIHHKLSWMPRLEKLHSILANNGSNVLPELGLTDLAVSYFVTDIPMIDDIFKLDYVLYTTPDVMFIDDVRPKDFPDWPSYVACARKLARQRVKAYDTSVMVMNLRSLRNTRDDFIDFITNSPSLNTAYGVGVHGSYSDFYRQSKRSVDVFPVKFSWNPEWDAKEPAAIVHFRTLRPLPNDPLISKRRYYKILEQQCTTQVAFCSMYFQAFKYYESMIAAQM